MTENQKRKNIALPIELHEKVAALATVEGKPTAEFVRAILSEYLDRRAADVNEAMKFVAAQKKSLEDFRAKNSLVE